MYIAAIAVNRYQPVRKVGKIKMSARTIAYFRLMQVCQDSYVFHIRYLCNKLSRGMTLQNLSQLKPIFKEAFGAAFNVAKFFCGLHVVNSYLCTIALSEGPSMLPTINLTGNFVLGERLSTRFGKVHKGDVVLIRSPINPRKVIIKRVVGLEGDSINYVPSNDKEATIVVPKGHIWIEGDNKPLSKDSRQYGPVPYGLLEARIFWVMWPPKDFGSMGEKVQEL